MNFNQLPDAVRALAILTTETNKEVAKRATETHVTGRVFCITLDTETEDVTA